MPLKISYVRVWWCGIIVRPHHHHTNIVQDKTEINFKLISMKQSICERHAQLWCIVVKLQASILCPKLPSALGSAFECVPLQHTGFTNMWGAGVEKRKNIYEDSGPYRGKHKSNMWVAKVVACGESGLWKEQHERVACERNSARGSAFQGEASKASKERSQPHVIPLESGTTLPPAETA